MTRTHVVPRPRRLVLAALALVPLGLVACGNESPSTRTASEGASTPPVVTVSPATRTVAPAPAVDVSYQTAEASYRSGDYGEARRLFEGYIATRPANPWGHYMLGMSAWKAGDPVAAESAFHQAIKLDSAHLKSFLNGARVLLDLGRNREALERAHEGRRLDSTSSDALRLIARAHHAMGQTDSAILTYQETLVQNDRDVWALNNLGVLYLDQGDPERALPPLARAVQLRSTAPVFQNNLGIALERTGHVAAARNAFAAALQADSGYTKASISLARVNALVADPADIVDLDELAQEFRIQLGIWRDNTEGRRNDGVVGAVPAPGTLPAPESTEPVLPDQDQR